MISLLQTADAVVVAEQTRMGLWQLFMSGGWLMWVLLILGGLTIFIFVERFMAIRKASEFDMNFMNRIRDYILDGKVAAAVDLCRKTNTPIARMIEKGIGRIGRPMSDVQSAIENVANLEVSKLETNLPILGDHRRRRPDDRFSRYGGRHGADFYGYGRCGRYGRYVAPFERYVRGDDHDGRRSAGRYSGLLRL